LECEHVNSFLVKMVCRTAVEFTSGGEIFRCVGHRVTSKGFTSIMPWLAVGENILPTFKKGDTISIHKVDIHEVRLMSLLTSPVLAFIWMWDC
jgi:DNA topoisomerase IA